MTSACPLVVPGGHLTAKARRACPSCGKGGAATFQSRGVSPYPPKPSMDSGLNHRQGVDSVEWRSLSETEAFEDGAGKVFFRESILVAPEDERLRLMLVFDASVRTDAQDRAYIDIIEEWTVTFRDKVISPGVITTPDIEAKYDGKRFDTREDANAEAEKLMRELDVKDLTPEPPSEANEAWLDSQGLLKLGIYPDNEEAINFLDKSRSSEVLTPDSPDVQIALAMFENRED